MKNIARLANLGEISYETLEGTYINKDTCKSFLKYREYSLNQSIDELEAISNPLLASQFMDIDLDRFLYLPTNRLNPYSHRALHGLRCEIVAPNQRRYAIPHPG